MGDAEYGRLKRKEYEKELAKLHVELVKLQEWVKQQRAKICIVFEGRDGAGKGGTIKALTERVSPRVFRVVALPAPTDREKSQMYAQRYLVHLPAAGEVVIFDRSWYNRAGVERVMGYCTDEEAQRFLEATPRVEHAMVERTRLPIQVRVREGLMDIMRALRQVIMFMDVPELVLEIVVRAAEEISVLAGETLVARRTRRTGCT